MWNNLVSYLHTSLQTAYHPVAEMAYDHLATTLGIVVLFAFLALMLSAEVAEGRDTAARIDEAPPFV